MSFSSTNLPPTSIMGRALHIVPGERPRTAGHTLPTWVRRRKARLTVVGGARSTRKASNRRVNVLLVAGVLLCVLSLALTTAIAAYFGAPYSSRATVVRPPSPTQYQHDARAAVDGLLPALTGVQTGIAALSTGNGSTASLHLNGAVAVALKAQTRVHALRAPLPYQRSNRFLRRSVDRYVTAVTATRDRVEKGNLVAAMRASALIESAEGDVLAALSFTPKQ